MLDSFWTASLGFSVNRGSLPPSAGQALWPLSLPGSYPLTHEKDEGEGPGAALVFLAYF